MKKLNNALLLLVIGSLASFAVSAQDVVINGQTYQLLNNQPPVAASSAISDQSEEAPAVSVRVGDEVAKSNDSRALIITGAIEVEVSMQEAENIAAQFNLELVGYVDGIALLNAEQGTDILALEKRLNTKVKTPVRVELDAQDLLPQ